MNICPRCAASVIREGFGALSRTTRDDGAPIMVCDRCGEREGLYGREPAAQQPLSSWPIEVNILLDEEYALITRFRESEVVMIGAGDLTL